MKHFLENFRKLNISFRIDEDGKLDIVAPKGVLTEDVIQQIKEKRENLMTYLRSLEMQVSQQQHIPVAPEQTSYPLSSSQKRLYIIDAVSNASVAYNMPAVLPLPGATDPARYELAIAAVVKRHEILRTVFREKEGDVRQWIIPAEEFSIPLRYVNLSDVPDARKAAQGIIDEDMQHPFDLKTGPLFRVILMQLAAEEFLLYYNMHHIISDGWSMNVLLKDVAYYYDQYTKGTTPDLAPLPIQYKDYAVWQQEQLSGALFAEHRAYWMQQLQGELPGLTLPSYRQRPAMMTANGYELSARISNDLAAKLRELCQLQQGTLFMGLMSVLKMLLFRYTGQQDIIVGCPVAGRDHADLQDQIGFYINTIALRTGVNGSDSFSEVLRKVREVTLSAYSHQLYPFDSLVEDLQVRRDMSRSPICDIVMVLQNQFDKRDLKDLDTRQGGFIIDGGKRAVKLDLHISFLEREGAMHMGVQFNSDIYDRESMVRFIHHYVNLLTQVILQPEMPLHTLEYISTEERQQLLTDFNDTQTAFPDDKSIIDIFRQRVKENGQMPAVAFEGETITYDELEEKSNKLAKYLIRKGVKPGGFIPICIDRSAEMIISILAILKTGCAYVPIDPSYPQDRIDYMLNEVAASFIISHTFYKDILEDQDAFKLYVDRDWLAVEMEPDGSPEVTIAPDQLAYMIFTSGSTGKPKGVMLHHRGVVNLGLSYTADLGLKAGVAILQFASFSFDASCAEIFSALLSGGLLVIPVKESLLSADYLSGLIDEHRIEVAIFPPSFIAEIGDIIGKLRLVISAGEPLTAELAKMVTSKGVRLVNGYGPTETTVCASMSANPVWGHNRTTIGKPLQNMSLYILDEHLCLLPVGVAGELYIGGCQLAHGYFKREDLTAERFIPHPFIPGERLYRSGDVARWLPDGNVEYLGRADDQVKVRGYRIEPGEIENVLLGFDGVDVCLVMARPDANGRQELLAYLQAEEPLDMAALRNWLSASLPDYMLPHHFIRLDKFPMTPNGKIDRKALPDPEDRSQATMAAYVAPVTETERIMADIWGRVLGIREVGIRSSFFELGGDSIKILRVMTELRKELDLNIQISDIYKHNTIENIISHVMAQNGTSGRNEEKAALETAVREKIEHLKAQVLASLPQEVAANVEDIYPMSDIEKGMVYESLLNEKLSIYHDQIIQRKVMIDFDFNLFSKAVELMAEKHEILRTSFNLSDYDTEIQIVHRKISPRTGYKDLSGMPRTAQEQHVQQFVNDERKDPFVPAVAPLWRIHAFNFGNDEMIFLFQAHHAIIDGWSDASFSTELHNIYRHLKTDVDYKPARLKSAYRDFIIRHEMDRQDEHIRQFWRDELSGARRLELFADKLHFDTFSQYLEPAFYQKIEKLASSLRTTVKVVSLSAYLEMLGLLSYEREVMAGVVTNNRPDCEDGDKILGCFLNTLPFRMTTGGSESVSAFITRIHEKCVTLKEYEHLSTLEILQLHGKQADYKNPFFDMIFNFVDFHAYDSMMEDTASDSKQSALPAMAISGYGRNNNFFTTTVSLTGGSYKLSMSIARQTLPGFSADKAGKLFLEILKQMVERPLMPVCKLADLRQPSNNNQQELSYYWNQKLKNTAPFRLEGDKEKLQGQQPYQARVSLYQFSRELSDRITQCADELGTTANMLLLTAFNALLYRYSRTPEIVTGLVCRNTAGKETSRVILKNDLTPALLFTGLLEQVVVDYRNATALGWMPLEEIPELNITSAHEYFDILVDFQTASPAAIAVENGPAADLNLLISQQDGRFEIQVLFNQQYYHIARIERMTGHYAHLLTAILEKPYQPLATIAYLPDAEKQHLLSVQNDLYVDYPTDKTIVQLFEEQVEKYPHHIAVVSGEDTISYELLNSRANKLAAYLRMRYHIAPQDLVGITLDKGIEMAVAIIAIIKAGGAYVPIDPAYPEERITYIATDSNCKVVIDEDMLTACSQEIAACPDSNLPWVNQPQDLAYVIYTSGTSGKPKGALLTHNNVVRLMITEKPLYDFSADDVWTMFHSYGFDFSVWEMYGALLFGGKLVMVPSDVAKDPAAFRSLMIKEAVTILNQTPSAFYNLIRHELENDTAQLNLRYVIFGGEALSPAKLTEWHQRYPDTKLINMYGITETTVHVTYKLVTATEIAANSASIGVAIPTLSCYVMDEYQQLLPIGMSGELCVGGEGVCNGYLNRPELTSQRFIPNPYNSAERLYRSGDRARLLDNGELEYSGRIDDQVKIRGYRIELGEIAYTLNNISGIKDAVVTARPDRNGEMCLVAYLVAERSIDPAELRTLLSKELPQYMLPDYFVQLKKMPLTSNGKTDKKSLPDPDGIALETNVSYIAPRNAVEEKLVKIWESVLGRTGIGVKHNFFECGGHSIKITRLASIVNKEFGIKIPLKALFSMTSLEEQANFITNATPGAFVDIRPVDLQDDYPVSSSQHRMWVLSQFEASSRAYYILGKFYLEGKYDVPALEKALNCVVARHEILRTTFRENKEGALRQVVHPFDTFPPLFRYKDMEGMQEEVIRAYLNMNDALDFDLEKGPLLRVGLIRLDAEKYLLHFNMHHIISDGWSMDLLKEELMAYYRIFENGAIPEVQPLKIQYKDYASWQQQQLSGEAFDTHRAYWKQQLSGTLPVLSLPLNRPRPAVMGHNGFELATVIAHTTTDRLLALCRDNDATLFMGLLAVMKTLLFRYSGQEDIIIGCPVAGREHAALEDQIGLYVNTLVMRTQLSGADTVAGLLDKIRSVALAAYSHQAYPFDKLVEELNVRRDVSHSAIFNVIMAFQNQHDFTEEAFNPDPEAYGIREAGNCSLKTDLHISFAPKADGLHMNVQYNTDIFDKETIAGLIGHFKNLLLSAADSPAQPISRLQYLSAREQETLLHDFNDTATVYPEGLVTTDLFRKQAALTPDHIALYYQGETMSYQELDEQSNQFAHFLQKKGVQKGMLIPLCLDRSFDMIVGILGIMKAGAAYVPIDPAYPQERIAYMLADTKAAFIVSDTSYRELFEDMPAGARIFMNRDRIAFEMETIAPVATVVDKEDLAYIIYTSGSTGNPKGVMIQHGSLYNYLQYSLGKYMNDPGTIYKVPLFTSLSFDLTVTSIFCPLLQGGQLFIYPQESAVSEILEDVFFGEAHINFVKCTPSHIELLKEAAPAATAAAVLILGGEELRWSQVDFLRSLNPDMKIYNEYGPTEATVGCITETLERTDTDTKGNILIGKPTPNIEVFILDEEKQLMATGLTGELYIGGTQLAKGYLNRPDLDAERFIAHPFKPGQRVYRTGDMAKWLPDGSMEYIGRAGDQVKIHGYRIETGEVEQALLKLDGISAACVVPVKDAQEMEYLMAYVVSREEQTDVTLRQRLLAYLPAYMVPSRFMQLEMLPLTSNGKVDRKALPDPASADMDRKAGYMPPRTDAEKMLVAVVSQLFDTADPIGIKDNFFELGGNSLKAISLINKLKQQGYTVKIDDVLRYPVLELLALKTTTDAGQDSTLGVADKVRPTGSYELSLNQQLYYHDGVAAHAYGHFRFHLKGFDKQRFIDSYVKVINEYEVLRLKFSRHQGKILQEVVPPDEMRYQIKFIGKEAAGLSEHSISMLIEEFLNEPFDIYSGQVIKCAVLGDGDDAYVLVAIHHLATDNASNALIKHRLISYFEGTEISTPAPLYTYQDFIFLQQQYLQSPDAQPKITFWEEQLQSLLLKGIPYEAANGSQIIANREIVGGERFVRVSQYCRRENVFMSTFILSVFYHLACQEGTAGEEFIIETVVNGQDMDLPGFSPEQVTGLFTGTLPLKCSHSDNGYTKEAMQDIQRTYMAARASQEVPSVYIRRLFKEKYHFPLDSVTRYHINHVNESGEMALPAHYTRYTKAGGEGVTTKRAASATLPVRCFEFADALVLEWETRCMPQQMGERLAGEYYLRQINHIIDLILENGNKEDANRPDKTDILNFTK
ncbi:non-ribosomal peptide synthetase [Chitinophaga varians]|uniref:non-ribosomal peptide synthetase n=1 Tax=Chitinophaga varians TaxID=2202339 RepID=UPI00165F6857|nr:non-ribosomal peptide synthetase [Chitinophaga varians]MBC9912781.1 amino acid adenylation domain-containing protein [Chitinophaga varians]